MVLTVWTPGIKRPFVPLNFLPITENASNGARADANPPPAPPVNILEIIENTLVSPDTKSLKKGSISMNIFLRFMNKFDKASMSVPTRSPNSVTSALFSTRRSLNRVRFPAPRLIASHTGVNAL